jgi:hypothetical protein
MVLEHQMTYNEYTGNRDDLIRTYIPFAYRVAINYRHLSYHNLNGLQGEALLTLCKTIDMIIATPNKWDIQIASIIAIAIRRELHDYGRKDRPIYQSRGAYRGGITKCPDRVLAVEDVYDVMDTRRAPMSVAGTACEMCEILDDMQLTKQHRLIVTLLLADYNNTEIGKVLSLTKSRISQIRIEIQQLVKLYLIMRERR